MDVTNNIRKYAFYSMCIALNLGLGALISYFKVPIFLDTAGTILATIITGLAGGFLVGIVTVVLAAIIYSPTIIGYILTAIVIVLVTHFLNKRGYFQNLFKTILSGLIIGICAAIISAPITVYVWGGISLTGQDFITAFIKATGEQLLKSVLLAGLSTDPIDKIITSVIVFFLLKNLPKNIREGLE